MRVKKKTVCQTCRTRKLGCDGKQPVCSQCALRGKTCDWDTPAWTFVSQKSSPPNGSASIEDAELRHAHSTPMTSTSLSGSRRSLIKAITQAYIPREETCSIYPAASDVPRVCGAWVGVLATLVEGPCHPLSRYERVLAPAVTALSLCLTSGSDAQKVQSYASAVDALRSDTQILEEGLDAEFAAAIMCLVLAELMFPDSRFGLAMHVNGVAGLFETSGPDRFKSGALQSLFVGFRPLLMVQAIQSRKATFIASKEWIEIPLSTYNPTLMQQLINLVANLPFLLEEADRFTRTPCETESAQVSKLWDAYIELLSQLERWEEVLNCERPGFWAQSSNSTLRIPSPPGTPLWFTNITMADFWAHMWAFQVICVIELGRLETWFQNWGSQPFKQGTFFCSEDSQRNIQSISRKICLGMEYLVQDDMKLFGPASAILPLQTAYKVFNEDNRSNMREMMYIERIVDCLVEKGLQSTPYLVYG